MQYKEKKAERDTKYRVKKLREERGDGEWEGADLDPGSSDDGEIAVDEAEGTNDSGSEDEDGESRKLTTHLDGRDAKGENGLSKKAAMFFDQEIFEGIDINTSDGGGEDSDDYEMTDSSDGSSSSGKEGEGAEVTQDDSSDTEGEGGGKIEIVKAQKGDHWDANEDPMKDGKLGTYFTPLSLSLPTAN